MFRKILAALDGSKESEVVLEHIGALAGTIDMHVRLVRVRGPKEPATEAHAGLHQLKLALARRVPSVDTAVLSGDSAAELIAHALAEKFDLIALTTHGASGVREAPYGSTAEALLRASPVPLFLVRPDTVARSIQSILVPLDGSFRSEMILPLAAEVAAAARARVHLLTVVPTGASTAAAPERLKEAHQSLLERRLESAVDVRSGDPAEQILLAAQVRGADLIALATHGRTGLDRARFGSVASAVLEKCRVPMLVMRTAGVRGAQPAKEKVRA